MPTPPSSNSLPSTASQTSYQGRWHRFVGYYILGVLFFLLAMTAAEAQGLSRQWIGPIFLFVTVMVYALIGVSGRTGNPEEYYVAGRRIPPMYNGMAAAADWMSAASFISLAGALYLQGFGGNAQQAGGLAYVLGWTGGFVLVAMLVAPHLRAMRLYTLPDFFQQRFGGTWPRVIAALATVLCSFTYVVAQIYGVGLIASRLTGVQFEIGIMLGLGGVLVCSFLGGMKAITWTQVSQYIVILLAFLTPMSWLAYKQLGNPVAAVAYGSHLQAIAQMEEQLIASPQEQEVRQAFARRAEVLAYKLENVSLALEQERQVLQERVRYLRSIEGDMASLVQANRDLANLPRTEAQARRLWQEQMYEYRQRAKPLGGLPPHTQPFVGDPDGSAQAQAQFSSARRNFLALMFCLMVGTAGLPHLLTRYYTAPSVAGARTSVAWSLFFIALLYLSAPALAAMVKYEVMHKLVGVRFDELPTWIAQWARVDPSLLALEDVNGDGRLQWGEIHLGADLIMLATPEIAGLPYVISGLVAAGGLAAALSTADGLLLTISNALVRDLYFQSLPHKASTEQRVIVSKFVLMAVALAAAFVASRRSSDILPMVTASFSLAASAFVPAMVLGIFWRGTTRIGAITGMLGGLGVTLYYMLAHAAVVQALLPPAWSRPSLWWEIQPISAAVFGVPVGVALTVGISLLAKLKK